MELDTGDLKRAQAFAKHEAGDHYKIGTVGPNTYDCSGFMAALINVLLGKPPHHRLFGTGTMASVLPKLGFMQGPGDPNDFTLGFATKSELGEEFGHTAGNLGGLNVECRGGKGVLVGAAARSSNAKLFRHHMHLPISGAPGFRPALQPKSFPGVLKKGSKGSNVELLQGVLKLGGAPLKGTGVFGPETEHHVKLFQVHRGLPGTGVVDKTTWDRLMAFLKPPKTTLHRIGVVGKTYSLRSLARRFAKQHFKSTKPADVELMLQSILRLNKKLSPDAPVPGGFAMLVPTTRP